MQMRMQIPMSVQPNRGAFNELLWWMVCIPLSLSLDIVRIGITQLNKELVTKRLNVCISIYFVFFSLHVVFVVVVAVGGGWLRKSEQNQTFWHNAIQSNFILRMNAFSLVYSTVCQLKWEATEIRAEQEKEKKEKKESTWAHERMCPLQTRASYVAPLTRWQGTIKGVNGIKNMR